MVATRQTAIKHGRPAPLGATVVMGVGVNFALFSAHAESVDLCLFDDNGNETDRLQLPGRTGNIWHGYVPGIAAGQGYGYRVHGRYAPHHGHRFNANKLLIDPYARNLRGTYEQRPEVFGYVIGAGNAWHPDDRDSAPFVPLAVVTDPAFDWSGVRRPAVPWNRSVIYELHVKGFTRCHPDVPDHLRGTYLGLAQPAVLDYLVDLGVTAVELLPCQAFLSEGHLMEQGLSNYWGYNPIALFAPHTEYAVGDPVSEFKQMVRALHRANIEVILDVVFNHTAEGGAGGPMLSLRGIDNATYYLLEPGDLATYMNFSGCGNTLDVANPDVLRLVADCLRYWVTEMQVDGFRFDLATSLGRRGTVFERDGAFFAALHQDPILSQIKLIAEPWDVGPAGYRLGHFPPPWGEWNDRFRESVRQFWRGDAGRAPEFAERLAGSSDFFRTPGRHPAATINYLACHDGFTLHDLVSYSKKHNEANREGNSDGSDHGTSWNCGHEGPTQDPGINRLRQKQKRNLLATLLLSQGVPMLMAGDEHGRTQRGNNNAYCQDNDVSWLSWERTEADHELHRFVRHLIRLRLEHPVFRRTTFLEGVAHPESRLKDVTWLGEDGRELQEDNWHEPDRAVLGILLDHTGVDLSRREHYEHGVGDSFLMLFNASAELVDFTVPGPISSELWEVVFDTREESAAVPVHSYRRGHLYRLEPHTVALLADRGGSRED